MTTKGTKSKEQFVSRWGNPIADDYQYCEVPGYILRNYHACVSENDVYDDDGNLITKRGQVVDLGMIDMMFVIHVMAFKYDTSRGSASPSLPTIASYAGVHVSNVRRIKKRLEQYGLMTVISDPGHTDVYEFRGLHEQCVRLEQGKTPIEGVEVTPSKNTRGSKNTRATPSKNTRTPLVKILAEDIEEDSEDKKKNNAQKTRNAKSSNSKQKKVSPHEPLHDALIRVFGFDKAKMTRAADSPFWKVAAELNRIAVPVDDVPDLYQFVKNLSVSQGWSGFSVNALEKHVPDYLTHKDAIARRKANEEWERYTPPPADQQITDDQKAQMGAAMDELYSKFGVSK